MQQIILFLLVLAFPISGSAFTLSTTLSAPEQATATGPYRFALPLTAPGAANVNANPGGEIRLPPIYQTDAAKKEASPVTDLPREGIPLTMSATLEIRTPVSPAVRQNLRFIMKRYGTDIDRAVSPLAHVTTSLFSVVMHIESRGNPYAVSPKGAQGVMQIDRVTQIELGMNRGDAFRPKKAIPKAAQYLETIITAFGDVKAGLLAYNIGPGNARKYLRRGKDPADHPYVRQALDLLASL